MRQQEDTTAAPKPDHGTNDTILFWGCFIALIATAFGFVVRAQVIGEWEMEFNLSETQKGQILGAGLWPFAMSILLFGLIVDKVGYGKVMVFAFVCHVASAIVTIYATGYQMLFWGTVLVALGNGGVEGVVNPVVATMFPREKTKWLSILHAGWPGGLVLGGILAIWMGDMVWQYKVALIFLPTVLYGLLFLGRRFPVQERVAAGISYREMLAEAGALGAFIIVGLTVLLLSTVFNLTNVYVQYGIVIVIVGGFAAYVGSFGRPLFIFLILIMIPLATTEVGTDSWITDLMTPVMTEMDFHPGWVLVYTAFIMMVLRLCPGPFLKRLTPLSLLAVSSGVAAVGLFALSISTGIGILIAATIFGFGKTFFWPASIGVVAERFPKGGALTVNMIAAVGLLGVGVVGAPLMGNIQDRALDKNLEASNPALHARVMGESKGKILGGYRALDHSKLEQATEEERAAITAIENPAKKGALATVAILPVIMLVCYLILMAYFRSIGGYKAEEISTA